MNKTANSKIIQWSIFVFAVIAKAALLRTFLYINGDRGLQVVAAKQLQEGLGYTTPQVELTDINKVVDKVLMEWPPLYSLSLAALLKYTGFDVVTSATILETAGVAIYLLGIWQLTKLLQFTPVMQMIVLMFKGTEVYEGMLFSFPTDFLATACLLWAVYGFMKYLESCKPAWIFTTAFYLAAAFLFRYIYITTIFILPLILFWNGVKLNNRQWRRDALILSLLVLVVVLSYLGYNKYNTGHFTYLAEWDKGFYPMKALSLAPLFWQAISHVTFVCVQVSNFFHWPYPFFHTFLRLTSTLAVIIVLYKWIKSEKVYDGILGPFKENQFFLASVLMCIPFLGVLLLLSITVNVYEFNKVISTWSYLDEDRYFLFPITTILMAIVWGLYKTNWKNGRVQYFFRNVLMLALVFQVAHFGYMLYKRVPLIFSEDPAMPFETAGKWNALNILFEEGKRRGDDVVLFSNNYGDAFFAGTKGVKIFRNTLKLSDRSEVRASQPSTVVLTIAVQDTLLYRIFIERYKFDKRNTISNEVHYITHLNKAIE